MISSWYQKIFLGFCKRDSDCDDGTTNDIKNNLVDDGDNEHIYDNNPYDNVIMT
jgi:hypothetical protein